MLGLSQAEMARRMGRPVRAISEIVKAEKTITRETALQLERVLGVPAHIWLGLETAYRRALANAPCPTQRPRPRTSQPDSRAQRQLRRR